MGGRTMNMKDFRNGTINVGENTMSVPEAKVYLEKVLDIVEWGLYHHDDIRTYQRRQGGYVWEEGIVLEFDADDGTGIKKTANIHYYVQTQPDSHDEGVACLRFGRSDGRPGYHESNMPFYGSAEDAADFLCGWLAERDREEQDEYFELTEEQKRDGYIPHEMSVSARKRVTGIVLEAARRYAREKAKFERECERINAANVAKAKKINKAV